MTSDHDELVRKYSTPEEEMTPEQRARRQQYRDWYREKTARGEVQSKEAFDEMTSRGYQARVVSGPTAPDTTTDET
ncbi:hypothetical protein [Actinopolyspora mortivallis]|uniref:hypothetical protein n=1 Tax=Actinopolyspora mortivallis TaxID=33906 RepID=UPI000368F10B|nr:hypothetical protein [Actinopolyspora mortivallis]